MLRIVATCGAPPGTVRRVARRAIGDIAAADAISRKFLDTIPSDLRTAGLVVARKGRGGGYRLARSPAEITVGEVLRVLDGPVAPIACASRNSYRPCLDCPGEAVCALRLTMLDVRNAVPSVLDARTPAAVNAAMDALADRRAAS